MVRITLAPVALSPAAIRTLGPALAALPRLVGRAGAGNGS